MGDRGQKRREEEGRGRRKTEVEDRGWGPVDGRRGCRGQGQTAGWQTV